MRYLQFISIIMVIAGLALAIGAPVLDLNETLTLAGMMLLLAGLVKVAVVYIWRTVAGFPGDPPSPDRP